MIVIGITGGVATGKTTVAKMFERLGAKRVDADAIVHRLQRPGTPVFQRIVRRFGRSVLREGGTLCRQALGGIVFRDRRALRDLCRIVHPPVIAEIRRTLRRLRRRRPGSIVVVEVPLLFESGLASSMDHLVVVSAPVAVAFRRARKRSGLSRTAFERRWRAQMPLRRKAAQADWVINNGGTLAGARRQVEALWLRLKAKNSGSI